MWGGARWNLASGHRWWQVKHPGSTVSRHLGQDLIASSVPNLTGKAVLRSDIGNALVNYVYARNQFSTWIFYVFVIRLVVCIKSWLHADRNLSAGNEVVVVTSQF